MKHAVVIICWISVIVTGIFLRFDDLAKRPFHADEATGARLTAKRMESRGGRFDPKHFHGPLLGDLAIPLCRIRGENHWPEMTKTTLRTLPAIIGCLLIALPLLWRRRFGDVPMLAAAAFIASSPLLVYYSRMFIHESLLVLFGMLVLVSLSSKPRYGIILGILIGLMFATKESFAISIIAWTGAGIWIALENRCFIDRETLSRTWRDYRFPAAIAIFTATITAAYFYTDGFRHPQGAIDAVRTFFIYETVGGHDKSLGYYAQLLVMPKKCAGTWWYETPILVLALIAYASTWLVRAEPQPHRWLIRFVAYSALAHFVIYSLIGYKTPWLACLPWAHVCLLAGLAFLDFTKREIPMKVILILIALAGLFTQFKQARLACGRYASDARNPYAYVPTQRDVESLETWLLKLRKAAPNGMLEPIAVVGSDYWPLPWYLRSFEKIGFWPDPPQNLQSMPLVICLPASSDSVMTSLEDTHMIVPRGLRPDVPVLVCVRNDIWKIWMEQPAE